MTVDLDALLADLASCGHRVREAIVCAEQNRLADVVGVGADGFDTSFVDRVAEVAALDALSRIEPRMNVLSEEVGFIDRGSTLTAIVDPVDATNNATAVPNFIEHARVRRGFSADDHVHGFPYYAFSVGVLDGERLVAGCVMNLATGHVYTATVDGPVRVDGHAVRPRAVETLAHARVALIRPETPSAWRTMAPIMVGARRVRITGCSALDLSLIACGTLDALVNPNRISPAGYGEKIVDYAGALVMLEAAGAVLTVFDGTPAPVTLDLTRRAPIVGAATPALHAEILQILHREPWEPIGGGADGR